MITKRVTLPEYLLAEQQRFPQASGDFTELLNHVGLACRRIAHIVDQGALAGAHGSAQATNVQGETQQKLDVMSNDIFLETCQQAGKLAGMLSEELDDNYDIPCGRRSRSLPAGL